MSGKIYGVADKAWQVVVGCDPHMSCAPRCWARKTIARIVECQVGQPRQKFFEITLTRDLKKWSGEVRLDEARLADPLKWRKPALIATGFHGDWGRLSSDDMDKMFAVIALCPQHSFLPLTKQPADVLKYFLLDKDMMLSRTERIDRASELFGACHANLDAPGRWPLPNVNLGCSVMNQAEADKYQAPLRDLAAIGWATHVWYEPAIGPVNWSGWEFLRGIIAGGESGTDSRPSNPQWHRDTRDWCLDHSIPFNFKQWGDWGPLGQHDYTKCYRDFDQNSQRVWRIGKKAAGRLLDGRTWDEVPSYEVKL